MRRTQVGSALSISLLALLAAPVASADEPEPASESRYESAAGRFYVQGGFAAIAINVPAQGSNLGFAVAGGYRLQSWLGLDVEGYWGQRDQDTSPSDTVQWGVTANAKVYPVALFAPDFLDAFQPYGVIGLGGGEYQVKPDSGGVDTTNTFIFRFGGGLDWLLTDHLSAYADFSLNTTTGFKDDFGGSNGGATGVVHFGAKLAF